MIDIVEIRKEVKENKLIFYIKDDVIYCKNLITDETVIVGSTN